MVITPIKTHKVTVKDTAILAIIDTYISSLSENSVVSVTSKIVAITQGRVKKIAEADKDALIQQEASYYLPREENKYHVSLTITNGLLVATAGIDESNGDGAYILWPENSQEVANEIRAFLRKKFSLKNVGVIITDGKTTPLRWGVTAQTLAYSGFAPMHNYIGEPDIFGRPLEHTQMSIIDNLACASALVMGEGNEQMPLAVIQDVPILTFQDEDPSEEELSTLRITPEEDLYAPLLQSVQWKKGRG